MAPHTVQPRLKSNAKAKVSVRSGVVAPTKRAKTSSERGRAFRERENKHQEQLEMAVRELRQEIQDKTFLHDVWNAKYLRSRHSLHASLARCMEEYYAVLRFGIEPERANRSPSMRSMNTNRTGVQQMDPVEFLLRVTHPDAVIGDAVGPAALIDQWRKYTAAHASYETVMYGLDIRGPEESPVVVAQLKATGRVTRRTFEILFPHAAHEPLTQQLIGKSITYFGTTHVRFSAEMQIVAQAVHFDFVGALVALGLNLQEVDHLMGKSTITATCAILEQPVSRSLHHQ